MGLGLAQAPPFPHVCILCPQDVSEDVSSEGEDDDEVDVDDEEDDDDDDEDDDDEATPQEAKYVWKAAGTSCDAWIMHSPCRRCLMCASSANPVARSPADVPAPVAHPCSHAGIQSWCKHWVPRGTWYCVHHTCTLHHQAPPFLL